MVATSVQIRRLSPEWRGAWDDLVKRSATGSVYHLAGWEPIFRASCGRATHHLLAERGGEIAALLPLVSVRSRILGRFLVSLPWTSYGGVCGDDAEARSALLDEAARIARGEGAEHIELRTTEPDCGTMPAKQTKVSMRRALPSDPDALWREFSPKLRSQIRRPSKAGLSVRLGGVDQLGAFYRVFARNMRDLGTPVFPRRFFRAILETFPEAAQICAVYAGDTPVAAGLLLGFKDHLEIPWAAALREFNPVSPNMLLYWTALRLGCERGYSTFDFGRSSPGGPHHRFKAQWGAEPTPLYWHYWQARPGPLPEVNPQNPRYRFAIRAWRRLPVRLTTLVGPVLARSLP